MKTLAAAAAFSALALALPAFAQTTAQTEEVKAELLADRAAVAPGGTVWMGLDLRIKQGWHTYWRTPGDSGQPTSIKWTLPAGVTAEEIQWPVPDRVEVLGIMNFGYHDHVTLLNALKVDAGAVPADAEVKADVTWLVCADVCIPQDASFSIPLKIDPAAADVTTPAASAIQAVRNDLPKAAPFPVKATRSGEQITFSAGPGVDGAVKSATYFPYQDGLIVNASPQAVKVKGDTVSVTIGAEKKSENIANAAGLLVVEREASGGGVTKTGYTFESPIAWTGPGAGGAEAADMSFALALLFAFLGGVILNVMPCVLPVLMMKAMSFIKQGGASAAERRKDALFYTAGVLAAFTALAGTLIALRTGGAAIGWGFQLQSPVFVAVVAYVMLLLGLNLSGVFVVGGDFGVGQSLTAKPGATGSFFTGLLAVVVAAPCTGPFMGAAVGYTLTQPPVMSLAIFEALALGLASPYLLLAFAPAAGKLLPRPGVWMDRVKQVLAFPLYGSVAWLVWVLAQQVDPIGLAFAFAGVIAVGFAAWMLGVAQASEARGRTVSLGFAGLAVIGIIAIVFTLNDRAAAPAAGTATAASGPASEPFSAARLKELQTAGRPVLIDFTAAWCLTCIVNERVALSHQEVADAIKDRNVAYLKADWTNQNPEITATLHSLGRDGVPLYVLYDGKGGAPKILPQLLTPALVADAIKAL